VKINRNSIYKKYSGRCAYCGTEISIKEMHVDHIHPKFLNGLEETENLNPACASCNLWKKTYTLEEFRREIELQVERLRRNNGGFRLAERFNQIRETGYLVTFWFERHNI
jgi:5-methylcytosine-specific restriction endonuclease McrA